MKKANKAKRIFISITGTRNIFTKPMINGVGKRTFLFGAKCEFKLIYSLFFKLPDAVCKVVWVRRGIGCVCVCVNISGLYEQFVRKLNNNLESREQNTKEKGNNTIFQNKNSD